jgi:uncharacterized protein (DUF58 family)
MSASSSPASPLLVRFRDWRAANRPAPVDPAARIDGPGWRIFGLAILELGLALLLALYSGIAAENNETWLAGAAALGALALAGWVTATLVPALARRTALRWVAYRMDYRFTRAGIVYVGGIFVVALAALNTGNNLLFMMLACLLAGVLISGVVSHAVLSGVELRLALPEHIFAGQPVLALAELVNHKQAMPSFSLSLVGFEPKGKKKAKNASKASEILKTPVYFPYLPRGEGVEQRVELVFPRRGVYRQDALGIETGFPFGFLQKTRTVDSQLEAVVYPAVEPTKEFFEILPLVSGELESSTRGRGHDLYSIRDYQRSDSARHVDWKASAKKGVLQVREFAREDERRVLLVLDPFVPASRAPRNASAGAPDGDPVFERAIALCASLAWHFYEVDSVLGFRTDGFETPVAPAGEIIFDILRNLATAAPRIADGSGPSFLETSPACLDASPATSQLFQIILTRQPRGSIPTSLWGSSYILFLEETN